MVHERDEVLARAIRAEAERAPRTVPVTPPATSAAERILGLQRSAGNQAVARWLAPDARTLQRSPVTWSTDADVQKAAATGGSSKFWQPLKALVAAYGVLGEDQRQQRRATLTALTKAIADWRGHQAKNLYDTAKDKEKAALVARIESLAQAEVGELDRPAAPAPQPRTATQARPTQPRPTQAMAIGGGGRRGAEAVDESGGTSSFQEAIRVPGLGDLSDALQANVMFNEVTQVDQSKLRVQINGAQMRTHDGLHVLDSQGALVRYVLVGSGNSVVLYASQVTLANLGARAIFDYPTMTSHAQVTGAVVGAGDFVITQGVITKLSNQSGTWHPHGNNLVTALRAFKQWGVLNDRAVKAGGIAVNQWIPARDQTNVDAGRLVPLDPERLQNL